MTAFHHRNRLANTSSPYLLAHADNPVDWYPWGEEAFAKAKAEDKPIFLSIGYHACHWCHVMERESFENAEIAAFLNKHFVSIKVDREERPDVDQLYMQVVVTLTGNGGWPMSVFLTPDKKPFFAGTYFPPKSMAGRPGFFHVLIELAKAYVESRVDIDRSAATIMTGIATGASAGIPPRAIEESILRSAAEISFADFDRRFGGFGSGPKFPQPGMLSFLFRASHLTGEKKFIEAACFTLRAMADGGIYDHLGGGFHRYAVDSQWLVPHFEKMLYDNALLITPYLEAYQLTGDKSYLAPAVGTLQYLQNEMTDPGGGLYSSCDADSEGEEGKYYLWTKREIETALGDEAGWFCEYFGVTDKGNFEEDTNILHCGEHSRKVRQTPAPSDGDFEEKLHVACSRLYAARRTRVAPAVDDKILASWNGLAISAFAQAYQVTGNAAYLDSAKKAADFVLRTMMKGDVLYHSYRQGSLLEVELLEDYAYLAAGLIELYQASFDETYLTHARRLVARARTIFLSNDIFYSSPALADDLAVRPREVTDSATPSPNSIMIFNLLRLAAITGDRNMAEQGLASLKAVSGLAARIPQAASTLLSLGHFALTGPLEIALVGDTMESLIPFLGKIHSRYLPNKIIVGATRGARPDLPLLIGRLDVDRATCFICRDGVCRLPVTDLSQLESELAVIERQGMRSPDGPTS